MNRIVFQLLFLSLTGTDICLAGSEMTGKEIFEDKCSHCHASGTMHPGTRQLAMTRGEDKAVLAQRKDLTADYVRYIVRHGINAMPPFVPPDIPEQQLEELIRYLTRDDQGQNNN